MFSHGETPKIVIVQQSWKVKFLRTHSSNSIETSFKPFMTIRTRLGLSIDRGDGSNITFCANVVLPVIGKQLGIVSPLYIFLFTTQKKEKKMIEGILYKGETKELKEFNEGFELLL